MSLLVQLLAHGQRKEKEAAHPSLYSLIRGTEVKQVKELISQLVDHNCRL